MSDQAFEVLRDEIITGQLPPGARLNIVEQAGRLGVSRMPITEALNRLAAQGLVNGVPRKGFFVSSLDAQGIAELAEVRLILELAAVERGIEVVTEEENSEMRRVLVEMETLTDGTGQYLDFVAFTKKDFQLHLIMVTTAHNDRLVSVYRHLNTHAFTTRAHYAAKTEDRSALRNLRRHQVMVEAFETRDLKSLKAAITANILSMAQALGNDRTASDAQKRLDRKICEPGET